MEPAFARGDILFLSNPRKPIDIGEICVFKIPGRDIPIVHRVIDRHDTYVCASTFISLYVAPQLTSHLTLFLSLFK